VAALTAARRAGASRGRAVPALALAALGAALGCAAAPPPPPRRLVLNLPGELVDVDAAVVAGHVTLVDFRADWCRGCDVMEARFLATVGDDPRIVLRLVDVGDGETPVARAYQIGALPHLRLYDRHRRLRYVLAGNDGLDAGVRALELAAEP
jgi:thiol-disulfide isomerase/thioredoxin